MTSKTLIISLPRGLYRLTKCGICKHIFKCENCDNNLTTIRINNYNNLVCSECQTQYPYPKQCPSCSSVDIQSMFGGRDYLEEQVNLSEYEADISNRIFDPLIDYSVYSKIIITHGENLFLGVDYQSVEETAKSLTELVLHLTNDAQLVIDQQSENSMLNGLENPIEWYRRLLKKESENRDKFAFPPAVNLILITASEKTKSQAQAKLQVVRKEIIELKSSLPELGLPSYPYEAKMLKRKGFYTMHMFMKYPKNYKNITLLNQRITILKNQYRLTVRLNPRHIF